MNAVKQMGISIFRETKFAAEGIADAIKVILKAIFGIIGFLIALVFFGIGIYWFCGSLSTAPAWLAPVIVLYFMTR
jgi:hypothetical protein